MEKFNFQMFVMVGFSTVELDHSRLEELRPIITNQVWIDDASEDGLQEADWCRGGKYARKNIVIPDQYKPFLRYIDDLTEQFFGTDIERDTVSLWLGGEELDWHEHITDREVEDFHWLIYLGDDNWHEEAGGLLLLKNAQMDVTYTVVPTYGTAVILNNTNKNYLHKVTKYQPRSKRIVLQISYRLVQEKNNEEQIFGQESC